MRAAGANPRGEETRIKLQLSRQGQPLDLTGDYGAFPRPSMTRIGNHLSGIKSFWGDCPGDDLLQMNPQLLHSGLSD